MIIKKQLIFMALFPIIIDIGRNKKKYLSIKNNFLSTESIKNFYFQSLENF